MACHGARRLLQMTDNLYSIIGIEALTAVQGVECRAPLATSPELQKAAAALRAASPPIEEDRSMADDLKSAGDLVASGHLNAAVSPGILPKLRAPLSRTFSGTPEPNQALLWSYENFVDVWASNPAAAEKVASRLFTAKAGYEIGEFKLVDAPAVASDPTASPSSSSEEAAA